MMQILQSKHEFVAQCRVCGCVFSYEWTDIRRLLQGYFVRCPQCHELVIHEVKDMESNQGDDRTIY